MTIDADALVAVLLLVSGCEQQESQTGDIDRGSDPGIHAIRTDTNTAFEYDEYTERGRPGILHELPVFCARDLPGTDFTDPRAHGSGFERTRAFTGGCEDGPGACYPARQSDWVVQR